MSYIKFKSPIKLPELPSDPTSLEDGVLYYSAQKGKVVFGQDGEVTDTVSSVDLQDSLDFLDSEITAELENKADKITTYTKLEVDAKELALQQNKANNLNDSGAGSSLVINGNQGTIRKLVASPGIVLTQNATDISIGLSPYLTTNQTAELTIPNSWTSLGLSITPPQGTYLAFFSGSIEARSSIVRTRVTVGGVEVSGSVRESSLQQPPLGIAYACVGSGTIIVPVTVNGSQSVVIQGIRVSGNSASAKQRTLTLIRIS